jgi:tRNA pseudouridine55 synthase
MTARRKRGRGETPGPAGFLVVDKPSGWTSHDVVDAARRWLGTRRVGHLGTLDPLATGVLPLAIREATKLAPFLDSGGKSYAGTLRLGEETDTLDADGEVTSRFDGALPDEAELRSALEGFLGEIEQIPPMYSAVKRGGVPLHRIARQGREVERPPKRVHIEGITLLAYAPPDVTFEVDCSTGTYVRTLAADLGARLGCGAHLRSLRRTRSGPFGEKEAATLDQLDREAEAGVITDRLIPPVNVLSMPAVRLTREETQRVIHGNDVSVSDTTLTPGTRVAVLSPEGALLAIAEARPGRRLQPLRVLETAPLGCP